MKTNYHTHTPFCKHATNSIEETINIAIKNQYNILGFSDHGPLYDDIEKSVIRMSKNELPSYVNELEKSQQFYKDKIIIKKGLEYEYVPNQLNYMKEIKEKYSFDYFLFGNHFYLNEQTGKKFGNCQTEKDLSLYLDSTLKAIDSGIYDIFAHPDFCFLRYPKIDKVAIKIAEGLIDACVKNNIPLEYNINGFYNSDFNKYIGYPNNFFWEIASSYKAKVIIGLDVHSYEAMNREADYYKACDFLKGLNVEQIFTI